jgi:hypothetical protein
MLKNDDYEGYQEALESQKQEEQQHAVHAGEADCRPIKDFRRPAAA